MTIIKLTNMIDVISEQVNIFFSFLCINIKIILKNTKKTRLKEQKLFSLVIHAVAN